MAAFGGCTPYLETPPQRDEDVSSPHQATPVWVEGGSSGTLFHRVKRGETLWRIAQGYGVDVRTLARVNRISDVSQIEVGRTLVIPKGRTGAGESFIWPVKGRVISAFGMRRGGTLNKGIDIQASAGTDVVAVRSGKVSFVHEGLSGLGKTIILEHGDDFATVYAYVGEILVKPGESVAQRQVIARVGQTGRAPVPALHFEVRRGQKAGNPLVYLP